MIVWIWVAVFSGILALYVKKKFSYFKEKGVNYVPHGDAIKMTFKMFTKQVHMVNSIELPYHAFSNDRYIYIKYIFKYLHIFKNIVRLLLIVNLRKFVCNFDTTLHFVRVVLSLTLVLECSELISRWFER